MDDMARSLGFQPVFLQNASSQMKQKLYPAGPRNKRSVSPFVPLSSYKQSRSPLPLDIAIFLLPRSSILLIFLKLHSVH